MTATLGAALEFRAWEAPDRIAISFAGDVLTYAGLEDWSTRIAAALAVRGVKIGDRVGVFATNSLDWAAVAFGIVKAGAILVPLNYRYTASELASVVENCTPNVVIADSGRKDRADALAADGVQIIAMAEMATLRHGVKVKFERELDPTAPTVIGYTSGSTAQPKGVTFTHETMLAYAFEASVLHWEYRPGVKAMPVAPFYTGAGTITLFEFIVLGLSAYMEPEFNATRALQVLVEEKIQIFSGVPTFWERIAAVPGFEGTDLSHIYLASTGGARVSRPLLETFLKRGVVLRQLYGLTEGGGTTTTMDKKGAVEFPEKCGAGGPFTKHKVVDPEGKTCPPNTPGEILVRGPAMMIGYWNNPQATKDVFTADGWLHTGDIGTADEQGRITVVDRLKDLIISGGLNISPLDIESVIVQLDGVAEVAVIPAADAKFGETPMAIVYASKPIDVTELIAHCNTHLADYKVPRFVVFEEEPLPKLATGKISKRALKEKYRDAADRIPRVR